MSSEKDRPVTIHDVAEKAGYSISAVSMALSGKGRIGEEASRKILAAAEELCYRPNKTAQSLSHKTIRIGAMIQRDPAVIQSLLCSGIHAALDAHRGMKLRLNLCRPTAEPADRIRCLERLCADSDGILLQDDLAEDGFERCIQKLNIRGCPVVSLVSRAQPRLRVNSRVTVNAEAVGRLAAQLLHMNGRMDTVIFAGHEGADIHSRNRSGFLEYARQYGMRLHEVFYTDDLEEKAFGYASQLPRKPYPVDGVFVSSYLAPAVCAALRQAGMDDVAAVGVDLSRETAQCLMNGQLCATIYQNQFEQAFSAVERLLDCILNKSASIERHETIEIKPELVLAANLECYTKQQVLSPSD